MRFAALDAWRGLAALMVALCHLSAAGWFYDVPAVRNGGVAVPLFFVLSGFVIHHAYGERLGDAAAVRRFVVRRFGRLYPLHLFTLALMLGLEIVKLILTGIGVSAGQVPFTGTNSLDNLAAQLVLLQAVVPFGYYGWNGPSWSISVEWAAYLVFAAVAFLAGSSGRRATWGLAVLAGGLLIAIESLLPSVGTMDGKGLVLAVFGFFTGGLVYQAHGLLRARGWKGGAGVEALGLAVLVALFWFGPSSQTLQIAGFALVILVFAFEGGVASRWLKGAVFQFLGRISYSIYLVHFVLLSLLGGLLRAAQGVTGTPLIRGAMIDFGPAGAMDVLAAVYLGVVILCAWATYVWVEVPGRTFFNALSDRRPVGQAWRAALADVRFAPAR